MEIVADLFFLNKIHGFSKKIPVAGERCNVTGEYFDRCSRSENKIVNDR